MGEEERDEREKEERDRAREKLRENEMWRRDRER